MNSSDGVQGNDPVSEIMESQTTSWQEGLRIGEMLFQSQDNYYIIHYWNS